MLDTMTFTKTLGALCGALLIFLLGRWAADELYAVGSYGEQVAYAVEVEDTAAEPEPEMTFEEAFAMADAGAGARVWGQCRACHQLEAGANAVGPYLHGLVGREIGVASGYGNYSGALSENVDGADVWTPEALNAFLAAPSQWAPGTSMSYRGLSDVEDRANLIAYIDASDE
jgi:cytochrome c